MGETETLKFALDLLFLFSYIGRYARSAFPQVLRRLLQEVRPRRVKLERTASLPARYVWCAPCAGRSGNIYLRSHPWQAASGRAAKKRSRGRPPLSALH